MWYLVYEYHRPGNPAHDVMITLELDDPNAKEEAKRKAQETWVHEFNKGYHGDPRFGWIESIE